MEVVMDKPYNDEAAADRYSDPDARSIRDKAAFKRRAPLSAHVPVRFDAETISAIRHLSAVDGLTVSSWIRNVCRLEVERRRPTQTETSAPSAVRIDAPAPNTDTPHPLKNDSFAVG